MLKQYAYICISALCICSCANRKVIRQTTREIDRPLFLSQKNWQVSFGAQLEGQMTKSEFYPSTSIFQISRRLFWFPAFDFIWPSIHIGDYVEILAPSILRNYLIKNVQFIDSIESITGTNIAIVNGISGFSYSRLGLSFTSFHGLRAKKPLSSNIWLELHPSVYFELTNKEKIKYDYHAGFDIPLSLGYQLLRNLSLEGGITCTGFYSRWGPNAALGENSKQWEYIKKTYDLDLHFPLKMKYVFNYHWEAFLSGTLDVYDQNSIFVTGKLLFSYTW